MLLLLLLLEKKNVKNNDNTKTMVFDSCSSRPSMTPTKGQRILLSLCAEFSVLFLEPNSQERSERKSAQKQHQQQHQLTGQIQNRSKTNKTNRLLNKCEPVPT